MNGRNGLGISRWSLRIQSGKSSWEQDLDDSPVVVGRAEDCTIVLDDEKVSKRHFEIHRDGDEFVLTDLGSRNGTRVNGRVSSDVSLRPGDLIELGGARLEVKVARGVSQTPAAPAPVLEPRLPDLPVAGAVVERPAPEEQAVPVARPVAGRPKVGRTEIPAPISGPTPSTSSRRGDPELTEIRVTESPVKEEPAAPSAEEPAPIRTVSPRVPSFQVAGPKSKPKPDPVVAAGPRRVEVLMKSDVPSARGVEARHGEKNWKLPITIGGGLLLGLLIVSFMASHRKINVEDNPLAKIHSNEGAPPEDLIQKKNEQEAAQARQKLLAESRAALDGVRPEAIAQSNEASVLADFRTRLEAVEAPLAAASGSGQEDAEVRDLLERTRGLIQALDQKVTDLKARHVSQVQSQLSRSRELLAAGRLDEARAALQGVLRLEPGQPDAKRMLAEIESRRAASAEETRRQGRLKEAAQEVETYYRAGVSASDLGNEAKALEEWSQAEEALRRLQEIPRSDGSAERNQAEARVADIQKRKSPAAPNAPKSDPGEKEAERLLGKARLYEDLGQLDKARELWKQVLAVVPNPEHRYHKMALQKLGHKP